MSAITEQRAPDGGTAEYGKHYRAGEFLPFYVPRPDMPQIDEADLTRLISDAINAGHTPVIEVCDTASLRAHQRIDHAKAKAMDAAVKLKPALVSADDYVLDGNHRWWAHVHAGDPEMLVIRIGLPFNEAITWLLSLPYTYRITPTTPETN